MYSNYSFYFWKLLNAMETISAEESGCGGRRDKWKSICRIWRQFWMTSIGRDENDWNWDISILEKKSPSSLSSVHPLILILTTDHYYVRISLPSRLYLPEFEEEADDIVCTSIKVNLYNFPIKRIDDNGLYRIRPNRMACCCSTEQRRWTIRQTTMDKGDCRLNGYSI